MTYVHPYEFDTEPLDVYATGQSPHLAPYWNLRQNLGRKQSFARLDKALSKFRFGAVEDFLEQNLATESDNWRIAS